MTPGRLAISAEQPAVLVCADLQAQHFNGDGVIGREASRCLVLLALWRMELWPVLHLKRIAQAAWFDPASELTDWSAEFRPQPGEMVFEHPLPSACSSPRFAEYMTSMRNVQCLVAGCSLDETVLATVVEGFHRGHRFSVVGDAVTCTHPAAGGEGYRASIMFAIGKFAGVEGSSDLIEAAASRP